MDKPKNPKLKQYGLTELSAAQEAVISHSAVTAVTHLIQQAELDIVDTQTIVQYADRYVRSQINMDPTYPKEMKELEQMLRGRLDRKFVDDFLKKIHKSATKFMEYELNKLEGQNRSR